MSVPTHTPRQPDLFGPDRDPLVGLHVKLERSIDRSAPCHRNLAEIGRGSGPHRYALTCKTCGRHRGWLPAAAAKFLLATIRRFGIPAVPLTWRETDRGWP
jgi:hypothetical protein